MKVEVLTPDTSAAGSAPCTMVSVPPERGCAAAGSARPARSVNSVASTARRRAGRTGLMMGPLSSSVRDVGRKNSRLRAGPLHEERDGRGAVDRTAALDHLVAGIVGDAVGELARLVDVPDGEVGQLADLEGAAG